MTGASLQAEILARLSESPDGRCICFYGARETVHWQSRSQLYGKSVAVAQQLRQEGLRPGDTCIIVLPSGETSANVLLATLLLGAVPLLIAPPTLVGGNLELHQTLHSAIHSHQTARGGLLALRSAGTHSYRERFSSDQVCISSRHGKY